MFFQAPSSNVQRGPNHYSRSWPHLVLSSLWECSSKPRISYRQGLGPSQLPLRHIHSLYTPISRIHSPCCAHTAAAPPRSVMNARRLPRNSIRKPFGINGVLVSWIRVRSAHGNYLETRSGNLLESMVSSFHGFGCAAPMATHSTTSSASASSVGG